MVFDENGVLLTFVDRIIHSLNKMDVLNKNIMNLRKNCILIGDSIHDGEMTKNAAYSNEVKIVFINPEEKNLDSFAEKYDILIKNDGNFTSIELLLRVL
jgi:hypothetical protein